jgi:hypothetical protein
VTSVPANAVALFNCSPSSDPSAFAKQSDSNPINTEGKELVHGLDVVRIRALSFLLGSAFCVPSRFYVRLSLGRGVRRCRLVRAPQNGWPGSPDVVFVGDAHMQRPPHSPRDACCTLG